MLSFLNTFIEHIEYGKCNIDELLSSEETGHFVNGHFRARGMIEYFQEQEVYVSEKDPGSCELSYSDFKGDRFARKHELADKYSSRSVYRFVPIPLDNGPRCGDGFEYGEDPTEEDSFPLVYGKFGECVVKMYDFTVELPEGVCLTEDESRRALSEHLGSLKNPLDTTRRESTSDIKINELIEVLSVAELQAIDDPECLFEREGQLNNDELDKRTEATRKRVVLHAISFKRISNYSPVASLDIGYNGFLGEFHPPSETCKLLRKMVDHKYPDLKDVSGLYCGMVEYIADQVCCGNRLLSEYILMCISSRRKLDLDTKVEDASGSVLNPPQIILHVSMCNSEFVKKLHSFLQSHLPRLLWINANVSAMNDVNFTPYFDVEKDKFVTGVLQLPLLRNLIVVDETSLEEGQLSAKGLESISNISLLTNFGYVNYNFANYQVPIKTESNCIILTTGQKSIFSNQSYLSIPLKAKDSETGTNCSNLRNEYGVDIYNYRANLSFMLKLYVSIVGSCVEMLEFDEQTRDFIAETFVNVRQKLDSDKQIHPSILHAWIMLARTQALMNGEERLLKNRFERFIELELERLDIPSNGGKNTT